MTVDAVLHSELGLIVAPAGCGKTHLITETLKIPTDKPYLVLTHTTAGVAALKQRLKKLNVPSKHFKIATIDGWALRVANMFPSCNVTITPDNPAAFYPQLRRNVNTFLVAGHIGEIIQASYSRLLVDEYQDCNNDQHSLVCALSKFIPTVVFGDPMQCIFDFSGPMPCWNTVVTAYFPILSTLNTPWRWNNAGTPDLGQWILDCRVSLMQGNNINLQSCPQYVHWNQLSNDFQTNLKNWTNAQYHIRKDNPDADSLLVIGDSRRKESRHNFARMAHGIEVVEPVDLIDVVSMASTFDTIQGMELAEQVLTSASAMMTGVGQANIFKRLQSILTGHNRIPATQLEIATKNVVEQGSLISIKNLLNQLENETTTIIFRRGAFTALKDAISMAISDPGKTMEVSANIIQEQRRHHGERRIPQRAIGSTLLLKGLEADHSLILDADTMNARHLYVALSRGAKSITIFSKNYVVGNVGN